MNLRAKPKSKNQVNLASVSNALKSRRGPTSALQGILRALAFVVVLVAVVKVVDLVLVEEERGRDGVHGRVAPPLIREPSRSVERAEVSLVGFALPQSSGGDFEVGPEVWARAWKGQLLHRPTGRKEVCRHARQEL